MTKISHVKGSDNVVADALSRYPEEMGQSYDHLLPDEHDMDLVCVSLNGNGADLLDSSTTPRAYSENVLEDLTLPLDPVSKLCLDGYDLSLVSTDVEARTFIEAYSKCSSKSSLSHFHSIPGMFVILRFRIFLSGMMHFLKYVQLNLPCKKFSLTYVGPFTIKSLPGDDAVY
jgi:hypothetical protein